MNARAIIDAAVLVLAACVSLAAHHSLTAEYDPQAPVTLIGRIIRVEWSNPHSFVEVEAKTADGALANWRVEAGSPAQLAQADITRETLALDTAVTISGYRAKDGSLRVYGSEITFANGRSSRLDGSMPRAIDADLPPPSFLEQLTSAMPFLPYVVGALPVIVLLAGVVILRRRRSVPQ